MSADPHAFDRYVQLPLILIAFLRAEGWNVAAYAHRSDERSWCLKVKNFCVVDVDAKGELAFRNMSLTDRRAIEAVRDRARTAFEGLRASREDGWRLGGPRARRRRRRDQR